jgi:hypothetical protein
MYGVVVRKTRGSLKWWRTAPRLAAPGCRQGRTAVMARHARAWPDDSLLARQRARRRSPQSRPRRGAFLRRPHDVKPAAGPVQPVKRIQSILSLYPRVGALVCPGNQRELIELRRISLSRFVSTRCTIPVRSLTNRARIVPAPWLQPKSVKRQLRPNTGGSGAWAGQAHECLRQRSMPGRRVGRPS